MPRGGARPGAGRPKGSKTKGATLTKNASNRFERIKQRALDDGKILPLDWFMGILNDPDATDDERTEAARYGAPFMHPRLEAVAFQDQTGRLTHEQALVELDSLGDEDPLPKTATPALPSPETAAEWEDAQGGMAEQPRKETPGVTGRKANQEAAA